MVPNGLPSVARIQQCDSGGASIKIRCAGGVLDVTLFVRIWHELALGGGALEVLDAVMDGSMQHSCGRRPLGCMELLVGVWSMTTAVPYQGAGYTDLSSLDPLFYSTPVASDLSLAFVNRSA